MPLLSSPLHARWTRGREVMDQETLATIEVFDAAGANRLFVEAERRARSLGTHRRSPDCAILELPPLSSAEAVGWVRKTLGKAKRPEADERVLVSWDEKNAVRTMWGTFASHWPSFCRTGADDVVVIPESRAWVLFHHHDERFYLG